MGSTCCKKKSGNQDPNEPKDAKIEKSRKSDGDSPTIQPSGSDKAKPLESEAPQTTSGPEGGRPNQEYKIKSPTSSSLSPKPSPLKRATRTLKSAEAASKLWSDEINDFAFDLYRKIAAQDQEANVMFSPFSIALALALLESGADRELKDEIYHLFGLTTSDRVNMADVLGSLQSRVMESAPASRGLHLANAIFYADDCVLKPGYTKDAEKRLKTHLGKVTFRKNPGSARSQVNKWVSDATEGEIPEFLAAGSLDERMVCVLVNGISMKVDWATRFDVRRSETRPFYRCGTGEKQIATYMNRAGHDIPYFERPNLQLIELPVSGASLSVYIVLPKELDKIGHIEKMSYCQLMRMFRSTHGASVRVEIPKFAMRVPIQLLPILEQLGLRRLKSFSRISADPRMEISSAVHQAYVQIDENGTAALSVCNIKSNVKCTHAESSFISFFADHPFLFAVVHKPTWTIIFLGKVNSVE